MLWTHFCFRGLWEDEMFARQIPPYLHDTGDAPADRGFECNASDNF